MSMAATQGAIDDLSTGNSTYLSTSVEEPELDSINFRQSLRFFQEQLIINKKGFPSPPSNNHLTNNDVNKFDISFSDENNDNERLHSSNKNGMYDSSAAKSLNSRISIPTVDTILESVRVLRAIQKSQEQRGSTWSLTLTKSDTDDGIQHSFSFENIDTADKNFWGENEDQDVNEVLFPFNSNTHEIEAKESVNVENSVHCKCISDTEANNTVMLSPKINETKSFWPTMNIPRSESLPTSEIELIEEKVTKKDNEVYNGLEETENQISEGENSCYKTKQVLEESKFIPESGNPAVDINLNGFNPHGNGTRETVLIKEEICFDINEHVINPNLDLSTFSDLTVSSEEEEIPNQNFESGEGTTPISQADQNQNDLLAVGVNKSWNNSTNNKNTEPVAFQNGETAQIIFTSDCNDRIQRSASNSPTTQLRQLHLDSSSDTCSSHYVSAECSPCASLYNESHIYNNNLVYSSQSVNNDTKKECSFDTADSSKICFNPVNDCKISETPPLSPIYVGSNISDECQVIEEQLHGTPVSITAPETVTENVEEQSGAKSTLAMTVISDEDSYHSFTDSNNPSPLIPQQALYNNDLSPATEDRTSKIVELVSESNEISREISFDTNGDGSEVHANKINSYNGHTSEDNEKRTSSEQMEDGDNEMHGVKKFTTSSWNLEAIMESLYTLPQPRTSTILPEEPGFQKEVHVLSQGAFSKYPEGDYTLSLQKQLLSIMEDNRSLVKMSLKYADVCIIDGNTLKLDNKLGRCLYFKCGTKDLVEIREKIQTYCLNCWDFETINLVHYPLKSHQNIIIIDLGSCSTRAGILMDQPTLPFIFFPSVCATNKTTGHRVYGKEALHPEVRQNSNLSFPLRPSIKIIKHSIDIDLVGGIFKKIFCDLKVDPTQYTVQVCLPRSLSISAQNSLVKLLLEDMNIQSLSLTHQALLTLYAHKVSTGVVVDVGDRMDILPVVDGFIVESGVTRLPYGGQRMIHHMKHALAEKHISLSNDIDSFVVQYISENLSYVAENYESEITKTSESPDTVRKSIPLQTFARDDKCIQYATLDDARFKIPEGLFKPSLWGLDNPGIHKLVQKAIQATSVDVRKKIAENIYVSGGVTMTPGFVERLFKEVSNLNKPRIIPKVIASNYRYHCTYIGACEFARMEVFPKVCLNVEEYRKDQLSSLKKFVLCF